MFIIKRKGSHYIKYNPKEKPVCQAPLKKSSFFSQLFIIKKIVFGFYDNSN
jgi:hypothetical protein